MCNSDLIIKTTLEKIPGVNILDQTEIEITFSIKKNRCL